MTGTEDSGLPEGTAAEPTAVRSATEGAQQSSGFDAAKWQKTLEALTSKLEEVDARSKALQGDKDRGVAQTKKEVEELKRQIAEVRKLEKAGFSEDAAVEEFDFRESVRQLKEALPTLASVLASGPGKAVDETSEAAKVISEYGLSDSDPSVARLYSLKGDALKAAAADMAYRRAKPQQPSAADAPVLSGAPASSESPESLLKNYQKDMKAAQGKPSDVRATMAKYKSLGVPVETVVFE
jgi:hypothetical protein